MHYWKQHPAQSPRQALTRMTGTGPAPYGYVPCLTIGGDCVPTWGPFSTGRADHYHPVGRPWAWVELAHLAQSAGR